MRRLNYHDVQYPDQMPESESLAELTKHTFNQQRFYDLSLDNEEKY